ncbi:polymer-forming cytoskeletal protein [Spongiibacter sp. IMCC21906]|uniref:bactofilin family protein n=1 Tax=Spongiibacter sp. IMCC21906 TaxID=1620392 RepID=UPI0009E38BC1|nr:polymer-forming cytoskeletal protein [Spongiibacter sp. IMCC21906]
MGFSSKNIKKSDGTAAPRTTTIAAGTSLIGNVELKDNFHLDGKMEGNLVSTADVTIGRNGSLKGDITAKRVLISGTMDGTIDADRLEIVASGLVTGGIKVREFVIESGGQFVGASQVKKHDPKPAPAPLRAVEGEQNATNNTSSPTPSSKDMNAQKS